jgi:hypothetical protein
MLSRKLVRGTFGLLIAENSCSKCVAAQLQPLQILRNKTSTPKRKSGLGHRKPAPSLQQKWNRNNHQSIEDMPEVIVTPQLDHVSAHTMKNIKTLSQPINAEVLAGAHRAGFLKISGDKAQKFMQVFWDMGAEPDEKQLRNACTCKIQTSQVTWSSR